MATATIRAQTGKGRPAGMTDLPDLILHRIPHHMRDTAIRGFTIVRRVMIGVYTDGFIHAGNLAYLALVTLSHFSSWQPQLPARSGRLTKAGRQSMP